MGKDLKDKEIGRGISQRQDGRYIARYVDKFGKRQTIYNFKLQAIKRALSDAKYETEHGLSGNGINITLNDWYVAWTDLYKRKMVKQTTLYKNDSYYNARIRNTIGDMFLKDIKLIHIQAFLNNLFEDGLAFGTVMNIRFLLNGIFEKAKLNDYIIRNPCDGLEFPKQEKHERRVLTIQEQKTFFEYATTYTHVNVLRFALATGCRIGEVLGLKWEDVNFEKRIISINKTIHFSKASSPIEGSKFFYTSPKTADSLRNLLMTDEVLEILKAQKVKQLNEKILKGKQWKQVEPFINIVFTCGFGNPIYYVNVNESIKEIVERINIIEIALSKEENRMPIKFEPFTPHCLRHTFATRCFEKGIEPKVIQGILGHAKLNITTDLYTHVTAEKQSKELENLRLFA
ncbi:MAG: tyrosine-type recombinase/integrase [Mobilitalea sp.]